MSITTYDELKTAVANWINRDDLTSRIPEFITLVEAVFNRRLDTQDMTTTVTGTISAETLALPSDFTGVKSFRLTTTPPTRLESVTADFLDVNASAETGVPYRYAIEGGSFIFDPVPNGSYSYRLRYRSNIPALSGSNPTNWVLTQHPDAYLFGACLQAAAYLVDDERIPMWAQAFEQILADINTDQQGVAFGPAPAMRARPIR